MQTAKHPRESAAKGDDQIAFENATALEEACSYLKALDWYAEVKPTGGYLDMQASSCRAAILLALHRPQEALEIGQAALSRMGFFSIELLGEIARAMNAHLGSSQALAFCRHWLQFPEVSKLEDFWLTSSGYAAQCGQFERSLRYMVRGLTICGGKPFTDVLLDFDFAPLWHHLEHESLSQPEAFALQNPVWHSGLSGLSRVRGELSFESFTHVPDSLRRLLRLHTRHMVWRLHRDTPPAQRAAFEAWCQAVRDASLASLDAGLRKALAFHAATSGECA